MGAEVDSHTRNTNIRKGDVLVPKAKEFPEAAFVVDGYDAKGKLVVHPLGGDGPAHLTELEASLYRRVDDAERAGTFFQRARFHIAQEKETFAGWADGQTWNGWARPRSERAEAERVIAWLATLDPKPADGRVGFFFPVTDKEHFDGERDGFITVNQAGQEDVWPAEHIKISDGSQLKVYASGAGCWCWDVEPGVGPCL